MTDRIRKEVARPSCALCCGAQGPFTPEPLGKYNALVHVCAGCSAPLPVGVDESPGYEPRGGLPSRSEIRAIRALDLGRLTWGEGEWLVSSDSLDYAVSAVPRSRK